MTALFCDLVGFTAASEAADPEDVHRMLSAYETMARAELERHGGRVEKFIGDAVVGIFGVPTAHEDDAERAVRAGLGVVAGAAHLTGPGGEGLRLRVGINSGEVLARIAVDPASGERLIAGDAINTASRIQSAAPEMAVVVGPATYAATRRRFDFDPLPPASLKGKTEPVALYRVIGPRADGAVPTTAQQRGGYVGRQVELARLIGLFDSMSSEDYTPLRLVTIVAEAGMGKSRLVAELRAHVEAAHKGVTWVRGRCLPYGDGITFWALGEVVKEHAGILESDAPGTARRKLNAAVREGPDRAWILERLLPLIGVDTSAPAERDELFRAWRRHLESMSVDLPAVLVFEDLHWADGAMLDFLAHVATEATGGRLLLIGTSRPNLFVQHPEVEAWAGNTERLNLQPFSATQTADLAAGILGGAIADGLAAAIHARAEGNPLYAEEYARLLRERGLLDQAHGAVIVREGVELPMPESVQALIAARLDTLPADRKALLADAAVIGKVFWSGGVGAMSGRGPDEVNPALLDLERQGFIHLEGRSTMVDEEEYAFSHILVRDVAYHQLPRGVRAARHAAAGTWLERKLGDRVEDAADVLADHWHTALTLATASGQAEQAAAFAPLTLRFLLLAGDRALNLDIPAALKHLDRALSLAPAGHPMRADVLLRMGDAQVQRSRYGNAIELLEEAAADFARRGAWREQARANLVMGSGLIGLGSDFERYERLIADTVAKLEQHEPSPELLRALIETAIDKSDAGDPAGSLNVLDRCAALAIQLGIPLPARALGFRGNARAELGDAGGFDDMREAVATATDAGEGREMVVAKINHAIWIAEYQGPRAALETTRAAIGDAERRGLSDLANGMTWILVELLHDAGDYDDALAIADAQAADLDAGAPLPSAVPYRIRALRGETQQVAAQLPALAKAARDIRAPAWRTSRIASLVVLHDAVGDAERSKVFLRELADLADSGGRTPLGILPALVRAACKSGNPEVAAGLIAQLKAPYPRGHAASLSARAALADAASQPAEALEHYTNAASAWSMLGVPLEELHARLGMSRCHALADRDGEAAQQLAAARRIAEGLGTPALVTP